MNPDQDTTPPPPVQEKNKGKDKTVEGFQNIENQLHQLNLNRAIYSPEQVQGIVLKIKNARETNEFQTLYALIEELLLMHGVTYLPMLKVVGLQSVGKSSLLTGLFKIPMNFSGTNRATVAPIYFSFQKNPDLGQDYLVTVRIMDQQKEEEVEIDKLDQKIQEIMDDIKSKKGFSDVPLFVKIQCRFEDAKSFTCIDTPGLFALDTEADATSEKRDTAEGIKQVTLSVLQQHPDRDLVLYIVDMSADPAHNFGKELIYGALNLSEHPSRKDLLIPVCTKADVFFSCNPTERIALERVQGIKNTFETIMPFAVGLFDSEDLENKDFEQKKRMIIETIENNNNMLRFKVKEEYLSAGPIMESFAERIGCDTLSEKIDKIKTTALLKALQTLPNDFKESLKKKILTLKDLREQYQAIRGLGSKSTRELLLSWCHDFASLFEEVWKGGSSIETQIAVDTYQQGWTLEDELENQDDWPKSVSILSGMPKLKKLIDRDVVLKHAALANFQLVPTFQLIDRLASEMRIRITSLEFNDPAHDVILQNVPNNYNSNSKDLHTGACQLVTKICEQLLIVDCCNYLENRVCNIVYKNANFIMNIINSRREYKDRFCTTELDKVVIEAMDNIVKKAIKSLKKTSRRIFSTLSPDCAYYGEIRAQFLFGKYKSQGDAQESEGNRLSTEKRIEKLSRSERIPPGEIVEFIVNEPSTEDFDKACSVFHRAFSYRRELFSQDLLKGLLVGGISERITGTGTTLYKTLVQIIDELTHDDGEEALNKKFLSKRNPLAEVENSLHKCEEEIKSLEGILHELNEVTGYIETRVNTNQ